LLLRKIYLNYCSVFYREQTTEGMAHIPRYQLAARHHAATTPGFLPATYVAMVQLNGGLMSYIINMGLDIRTQLGEEEANLIHAIYTFSLEQCILGLGEVPYNPFPHHGGPPPLIPNQEVGAGGQQGPGLQNAAQQGHGPPNVKPHGAAAPNHAQAPNMGVEPPQAFDFDDFGEFWGV
jgi:hypothetical protein